MNSERAEPWYDNMYTAKVIANFRGLMKNKHWWARVSPEKIRYIYACVYSSNNMYVEGKTELPYVVLILIFSLNIVKTRNQQSYIHTYYVYIYICTRRLDVQCVYIYSIIHIIYLYISF